MNRRIMAALIALLVLLCTLALFLAAPASAQPARQINERPAASWWLVEPCDPDAPPAVRVEPAAHAEAWAWCPGYGGQGVVVAQGDWGSVWVGGRLLWQRTWLVEVWR